VNGSLDHLLSNYNGALTKENEPLSDSGEYMQLVELHFLVKNIRELTDIQLYQTLSKADTLTFKTDDSNLQYSDFVVHNHPPSGLSQKTLVDREQLTAQINRCDKFLSSLDNYISSRTSLAEQAGMKIPRVLRLSRKYGFSKCEERIFLLMTVMQGSKSNSVLNSLVEEDYYRKVTGFQRLSDMCEVDIDIFCDGERSHMKEGIVLVDEDNGSQINLRIQRTAVQLLYGRQVRMDDLLKISQTSLEEILQQEGTGTGTVGIPTLSRQNSTGSTSAAAATATASGQKRKRVPELKDLLDLSHVPEAARAEVLSRLKTMGLKVDELEGSNGISVGTGKNKRTKASMEGDAEEEDEEEGEDEESGDDSGSDVSNNVMDAVDAVDGSGSTGTPSVRINEAHRHASTDSLTASASTTLLPTSPGGETSALKAYPADSQLEFLEDCFQMIALMIKGNVARMKDDMKKEGATSRYNSYDGAGELKHSRRELVAKLRVQESRVQVRLNKTREANHPVPRLEVMNQRFQLDPFEKKIILLLIGKTVSPIVKTLMETLDTANRLPEDVLTVGQALSILCPDFHTQIAHRRYFYQSGRLLSNAIISLSKSKWHVGTGDLTENRITLDRRILDWVVGLDSEINELVEGSDLYEPVVDLTQVVLPQGYAESILSQCSSYDYFQTYRQEIGLNRSISYGNSLVILLCGKSGTGKTMTVNAIAHELHKKVLLVDFNSLMNKKDGGGSDLEVDLKGLFRESKMSNTVLFFDECEVIFKSRNMGSERLLNSLLTEIERHEGIVFMATNRPYEIDEAMHRRINMVLEYSPPDYAMRRRIWDNLLGEERVKTVACTASNDKVAAELGAGTDPLNKEDKKATPKDPKKSSRNGVKPHPESLNFDLFPTAGPLAAPVVPAASKTPAGTAVHGSTKGIPLAEDVNTSELAVRYELTGGFIKNAVLSAVLTALSRSNTAPLVTQADLIAGCKLQMRGNLTQRSFEDRIPSGRSLKELFLSPDHRKQVDKIVRHELARSKVYGEWSEQAASVTPNGIATGAKVHCEQRASINLFAGTRGSGKGSLAEAIGQELGGRRIKYIHSSDFMGQNIAEVTAVFKTLVHDARIMDALIIIDGFEHILDDGADHGGGGGSAKLQMMLSRIMDILYAFHGCVCLLCHMENPQNMMLQREFATRLFSFLRFTIAGHEIRTSLWKELIPPGALPTTTTATTAVVGTAKKVEKLNFEQLGRRFELNAGSIRAAIASAVSEAAMRDGADKTVKQADLMLAGEQEVEKLKGGHFDIASKLFT